MTCVSGCSAYAAQLILAGIAGGLEGYGASGDGSSLTCSSLLGSQIVANDGTSLGKITSSYDGSSIFNEYGTYGNKYSGSSIWNTYGTYGNKYNSMSPFNSYSATPPVIVKNGVVIAVLTTNSSLRNAVNPSVLRSCKPD